MDKPEKPPWDFSGPDPPPVERKVRPIPPAFLTAARVRQMVEKVLGRLWHLHMRVGHAVRARLVVQQQQRAPRAGLAAEAVDVRRKLGRAEVRPVLAHLSRTSDVHVGR